MEIHSDTTCIVMNQSAKVSVSVEKLSVWGLGQGLETAVWRGRDVNVLFILCVILEDSNLILNNKESPTGVRENVTVFNYITKRA